MDIWTLVKAGMRSRKGIFFGFALLTGLIVVSLMTMIGVSNNYEASIDRAFELEDKGVIYSFFNYQVFDDELRNKVQASKLVNRIGEDEGLTGVNFTCNDKSDGNGFTVIKMQDSFPVFSDDYKSLEKYTDKNRLKAGEIMLPYGLKTEYDVELGDKVTLDFLGETREFTIAGIMQEPFMGSNIMGYKTVCISDEEFQELYTAVESRIKTDDDIWALGKVVFVYPSEAAPESSDMMIRKLNLETNFNNLSARGITRETSEHYTGIYINIILAVVTGFAVMLFIIFLIVAGHNLSTEIDIDYTNLGILKSQGMGSLAFRKVYLIEYLLAVLIGSVLGFAGTVPLEMWMGNLFFGMTGILPMHRFPIAEGLILVASLFFVTSVYIFIFTKKLTKVSPVKAISNNKEDIYFGSRLNAPITKRGLGISLGFRQITAAPKRYISIVIVTTLLVFIGITVQLMGDFVKSRDALDSMGEPFCEIEFAPKVKDPSYKVSDIENIVKKYTDIKGRMYKSHVYLSVNGESVMTSVKAYPDEFSSVYKGREVKYDNEIVVSQQVSDLLDIHIGDTVSIGRRNMSEDYIIVGIWQTMNDTGKAISMSLDGFSRLREDPTDRYTVDQLGMYGISIEDSSAGQKIVDEVKDKYGDDIEIEYKNFDESLDDYGEMFYVAADGMGLLIYTLTFIFALVTVVMMCTKLFYQERTNIGISRAIGFKVNDVRGQFAFRFGIICLISSVFGVILSRLFASRLISVIFAMFGIPHIEMDYTVSSLVIPIVAFVLVYMLFGYIASRKVKRISSRELITE